MLQIFFNKNTPNKKTKNKPLSQYQNKCISLIYTENYIYYIIFFLK